MTYQKHNTIWNKFNADIKKEFDSEFVYHKIVLKTKIKCYGGETTDFHDKEIPEVGSDCTCLAGISIDSILNKNQEYYPQAFLK